MGCMRTWSTSTTRPKAKATTPLAPAITRMPGNPRNMSESTRTMMKLNRISCQRSALRSRNMPMGRMPYSNQGTRAAKKIHSRMKATSW